MRATDFQGLTTEELIGMRRDAQLALHKRMINKTPSSVGEANGAGGSKSATFAVDQSTKETQAYIDRLTREIDRRQGNTANRREVFYPWA